MRMMGMVMRKMVLMMLEIEVREKRKEKSVVARKAAVKSAMLPVPKKRFRAEAFSVKEAARGKGGKAIKQEVKEDNLYVGAVAEADIGGHAEADVAESQVKVEVKREFESDVEADAQDLEEHYAEAV